MSIVALVAATLKAPLEGNIKRPSGIRYTGETLIVCPPSITKQWAEEFNESSYGISVLVSFVSLNVVSKNIISIILFSFYLFFV